MNNDQSLVKLHFQNNKFYVWDADDVLRLRKKHHIIGSLVGSIADNAAQNQIQGLPMLLNNYEAAVLIKNGFCLILDGNQPYPIPTAADVEKFKQEREAEFIKQDEDAKIKKKLSELQYKDIKNVKRTKNKKKSLTDAEINPQTNSEPSNNTTNINNNEVDTVNNKHDENIKQKEAQSKKTKIPAEKHHGVVTIFVEDHWITRELPKLDNIPLIEDVYKQSKYIVFEDFWKRGFYVTVGSKFGGDFLAYPGDPFRYHAHYIVRVASWTDQLGPLDLVAFGRLAMSVNKSPVIASVNPETSTISYCTLEFCK